jgi:predicted enzyme related to lactoylglutathione lyase
MPNDVTHFRHPCRRLRAGQALAVQQNGGRVLMAKMEIPTVGWLLQIEDIEGNVVGVMRYATG